MVAFVVVAPDNELLLAALLGAISELSNPNNWEQFGTMTTIEAALLFCEAFALTVPITEV